MSATAAVTVDIVLDELVNGRCELLILFVFDHQGRELRVKTAEQFHVTIAVLVQYRDDVSLAKRGIFGRLNRAYVANQAVVANTTVVDIVAYVFNQAIVANSHVAQYGITDSRVLAKTLCYLNLATEIAQLYVSVEIYAAHVCGLERVADEYLSPILGCASLLFENCYFLFL